MHNIRLVSRLAGANAAARTVSFVLSTANEDRAGDTIDQSGWMLENYRANPVVLWAHDSRNPPIGKCSNVRVTARGLEGDVTFASADEYEFADTVYRLCKGGFINAGSVGFMSHAYSLRRGPKEEFLGIHFEKNELTEFSICPVPMNPDALAVARSLADGAGLERLGEEYRDISDYPALRAELLGDAQKSVKAAICRANARAAAMANATKLI